jgi:hypothetical protein
MVMENGPMAVRIAIKNAKPWGVAWCVGAIGAVVVIVRFFSQGQGKGESGIFP